MSFDPGLASCGMSVVATDLVQHELVEVCVCITTKTAGADDRWLRDTRVHRAREIRAWSKRMLAMFKPCAVVIEDFGFIQQSHATACLAMAYEALICSIDDYASTKTGTPVPIVAASAAKWRDSLAKLEGEGRRRSVKGMTKADAKRIKDEDRAYNRKRTVEREKRAHAEALRRVQGSTRALDELVVAKGVHVLDSLGLFCWGVETPPVRNAVQGVIYG